MPNQLKTKMGENNECFTPKWVFDALDIQFDLDVAAPLNYGQSNQIGMFEPQTDKLNVTNVPAKHKYTIVDNGLHQPWFGNVWMNPPFSDPTPWVHKFMQHANGIALLPTSTGKWQIELWNDNRNVWVMLPSIRFEGYKTVLPTRCYLVSYGERNAMALNKLGITR